MTLDQAIAEQPQWVQLWLNVLVVGTLGLPAALLIWSKTRVIGLMTLTIVLAAGFSVLWLYDRMGYVKLLGLPHVLLWTPLVIYQIGQFQRRDLPPLPKLLLGCVIATMLISLAFDYTDVLRYIMGERIPTALPA